MRIPFLDIRAGNEALKDEIDAAIQAVIESGAFAGGPFVTGFEADFAEYCRCEHAIGVGSGTEALWLALLGLEVGPGDEVITVPATFMATAEAITYSGARPVFVDIDPLTYTMDLAALERAITPKTKAIIPVHLFGQPADMDPIMEVAREHRLFVVEDACQAHGAEYKGRRTGSIGDAGCFSFYPGKNLGALGEAGAIVTNNRKLQERLRILRDHGQIRKYHHTMIGWNCRMDGIQAAVLRIKLRHLDHGNRLRRARALEYDQALADIDAVTIPRKAPAVEHVYHLYAVRVQVRDQVIERLAEKGIGTGIHYPVPIHLQDAYESLGYRVGSFPIAEQCASEFISLPMYPQMPDSTTLIVADAIRDAVAASFGA